MTRHITQEAAQWLQTLREPASEQHEAFVDWIRASPEHLHEFLLVMTLNEELARADWNRMPHVAALLDKAATNVVEFPITSAVTDADMPAPSEPPSQPDERTLAARARWPRMVGMAAAALLAIAIFAWWTLSSPGTTYATAIGEQRMIALADGSIVNLNSRSRIKVVFTESARDILLDGEAMFKVEHDAARPFRVYSGAAVIQAIGTQFNVHRQPSGTTVSVIEGVVQVTTKQAAAVKSPSSPTTPVAGAEISASAARLTAGEEARIDRAGRVARRPGADTTAMASWGQHRLVFRDNTLEDIAAEFNRWNRNQIRIEGGNGESPLYDGAFDANDPESLIDFLTRKGRLVIERKGDEIIIRPRN